MKIKTTYGDIEGTPYEISEFVELQKKRVNWSNVWEYPRGEGVKVDSDWHKDTIKSYKGRQMLSEKEISKRADKIANYLKKNKNKVLSVNKLAKKVKLPNLNEEIKRRIVERLIHRSDVLVKGNKMAYSKR